MATVYGQSSRRTVASIAVRASSLSLGQTPATNCRSASASSNASSGADCTEYAPASTATLGFPSESGACWIPSRPTEYIRQIATRDAVLLGAGQAVRTDWSSRLTDSG
jgi:hypothetical protein